MIFLKDEISTAEAGSLLLGFPGVTGIAEVLSVVPKVGALAMKYPAVTEGVIAGGVNTAYQLGQNKPFDTNSLLQTELSTLLTRNKTLGQQVSINIGLSTLGTENAEDYGWNALGAVSGTISGNYTSKYKFGNAYIDKLITPSVSGYFSEFLGDPDKLKSLYEQKIQEMKYE